MHKNEILTYTKMQIQELFACLRIIVHKCHTQYRTEQSFDYFSS